MIRVRRLFYLLMMIAVLYAISGCRKSMDPGDDYSYIYSYPENLNDGIATGSLTEVDLSVEPLKTLMEWLYRNEHLFHGLLLAKDGKLVVEEYFFGADLDIFLSGMPLKNYDFNAHTPHYQASVSKSVSSILMGIALEAGFVDSVQDTVFKYFPGCADLAVGEKAGITIEHMLGMCSGLSWDESAFPHNDPRSDHYKMLFNEDPVRHILEKPMISTPGSEFLYNSGTTNVFADIIRLRTGLLLGRFAEQILFDPLGIDEYRWMRMPGNSNITFASGGLYIKPRDMMKIGLLFANRGVWNGVRIVSEDWVEASTTSVVNWQSKASGPQNVNGYGYQWWLSAFDNDRVQTWSARGWGGQYIIVFPDLDMVLVLTGGAYFENNVFGLTELLDGYILRMLD